VFKPKHEPNARDKWFRSSDWDEPAQREFYERLARAVPDNQVQYRRIKAIALLASRDRKKQAAGLELLASIIGSRDARNDERVSATAMLAAHQQEQGQLADSEQTYRRALELMRVNRSGSTQLEEIGLAEVLLSIGGRENVEEARDLVELRAKDPPLFLNGRFRLAVAAARVYVALGEQQTAAEWATVALDLAERTKSGLARHPDLGLVHTDNATRKWLSSVASKRSR
jgi:hypothetical protein